MSNKLGIILRTQLKATLGRRQETKRKNPALGNKQAGFTVFLVVIAVVLAGAIAAFSYLIATVLSPMGLLHLLPAVMMSATCITTLITTIYKTNGLLFGFKDYDLVMSLPVSTSTVITSRLIILYVYNMMFCLLLLVPSGIIYAIFAGVDAAFWPVFILCLLLVPLVPVIVATAIGTLIAWIASHFKRKSGMSIIFTVAFFLLYLMFCMNMNTIAENFGDIGQAMMSVVNRIYPLALWYTQAVCDLNMASFALFAAVSLGTFALFTYVIAKNFKTLNSSITANRTTSNYKMQELKQASPKAALFKKEWKRFTSSSAYVLNASIGVILLTIASILMLVLGVDRLIQMMGFGYFAEMAANLVPFAMAFCLALTYTTVCSISLEGKNLWIIKSLPVRTKDIFLSKLWVNLALVLGGVLLNGTLICIALQPTLPQALMIYLTPLAYGLFSTTFGMRLNLSFPNFKWDSEVMVIKRGMPVLILTLVAMGLVFVPLIFVMTTGPLALYLVTAGLLVASLLLYHSIMTGGVRDFENYEA